MQKGGGIGFIIVFLSGRVLVLNKAAFSHRLS